MVVDECGGLRSPIDLALVPWYGVARRASGDAACFQYARTRNRTMARDSLPLESCGFERVSRRYEVAAEARADRAPCGFLIKVAGKRF